MSNFEGMPFESLHYDIVDFKEVFEQNKEELSQFATSIGKKLSDLDIDDNSIWIADNLNNDDAINHLIRRSILESLKEIIAG